MVCTTSEACTAELGVEATSLFPWFKDTKPTKDKALGTVARKIVRSIAKRDKSENAR